MFPLNQGVWAPYPFEYASSYCLRKNLSLLVMGLYLTGYNNQHSHVAREKRSHGTFPGASVVMTFSYDIPSMCASATVRITNFLYPDLSYGRARPRNLRKGVPLFLL